ncbi:MAG: ferredoxin family protein [Desulfobaccales bacterium]
MAEAVWIDEEECLGCGSGMEICPGVLQKQASAEKAEIIKPEGGPKKKGRDMETLPWLLLVEAGRSTLLHSPPSQQRKKSGAQED